MPVQNSRFITMSLPDPRSQVRVKRFAPMNTGTESSLVVKSEDVSSIAFIDSLHPSLSSQQPPSPPTKSAHSKFFTYATICGENHSTTHPIAKLRTLAAASSSPARTSAASGWLA